VGRVKKVFEAGGLALWKVADGSRPAICVVDFARFADVTTLADLLGADNADRAVYRVDAVSDFSDPRARMGIPDLAGRYAMLLSRAGVAPRLIAGYCSTAILALHLNHRLPSPADAVVLVEPTWPTVELVWREAADIAGGLGADLSGAGAEELDLAQVGEQLRSSLRRSMGIGHDPTGDDDAVVAVLAARYDAWLTFLGESADAPIPPPPTGLRVLLTEDGGYGIAPTWPADTPSTVLSPPHDDLLEYPDVRRFVHALLDA
jgi:hypothetical protein